MQASMQQNEITAIVPVTAAWLPKIKMEAAYDKLKKQYPLTPTIL